VVLQRLLLFLAVCVVIPAVGAVTLAVPEEAPASERRIRAHQTDAAYMLALIRRHRTETWRWQRLMRRPLSRASMRLPAVRGIAYRRRVLRLWAKRVQVVRRQAASLPRRRAWTCLQRHEGPWNDPHGPYYGGLQMDLAFQRRYGVDLLRRKGTADRWTPLEQMWVAERAYRSGRGFWPWPNTARSCGLL
jgi:hypothetical protein